MAEIFGNGTRNPYFTVDTAAVSRGDTYPEKNPDTVKFDYISFNDVLAKGLKRIKCNEHNSIYFESRK